MANNAFGVQGNAADGAWSSGLCDCFDDVGGCKSSSFNFNPTLFLFASLAETELSLMREIDRSCRLPDVLLPVRHLREDRPHRRPGIHLYVSKSNEASYSEQLTNLTNPPAGRPVASLLIIL